MRMLSLEARVQRLEELSRGLAREVLLWKEGNDLLLYAERRAYLSAIQNALSGIEDARVVLARARQRLGKKKRTTETQRAQREDTQRKE
jgi:hypothetical protein